MLRTSLATLTAVGLINFQHSTGFAHRWKWIRQPRRPYLPLRDWHLLSSELPDQSVSTPGNGGISGSPPANDHNKKREADWTEAYASDEFYSSFDEEQLAQPPTFATTMSEARRTTLSSPQLLQEKQKQKESILAQLRKKYDEIAFLKDPSATYNFLLAHLARRALRNILESKRLLWNIQSLKPGSNTHRDDLEIDGGGKALRILDVGCGTGQMFRYYLQAAASMRLKLDIIAIDLSLQMVQSARRSAEEALDESPSSSISVLEREFTECRSPSNETKRNDANWSDNHIYDGILINRCFGEFFSSGTINLTIYLPRLLRLL